MIEIMLWVYLIENKFLHWREKFQKNKKYNLRSNLKVLFWKGILDKLFQNLYCLYYHLILWKNCNFDSVEWMNCSEKIGKIESHAVEILLENVSNEYLCFLREKEISYFFSGKNEFDFDLALKKMKQLFNVNNVILAEVLQ